MSDGLSADVKRHLARVYAILAACILTSAGSCAALLALVPWVPPYTYVVLGVSIAGLLFGVIAFACMPRERFVARYALLMAMCAFGGTFLVFFVQAALAEDPAIITTTLSMTALIFVSFSAAAILTPQKKVVMYMVALALAIVTLAVFCLVLSIFSIFVYSSALQQVYTVAALAAFSLYIAWETEMIIERASEGDRDPVGDAARLFSDLIDVFLRVASCVASAKRSDASDEKAPLLEGSVA